MSKEKIKELYNQLVSTHDEYTHILLILNKIIESIDENDSQSVTNLELEMMYIISTYMYNKQLLYRFSKDLKRILTNLDLDIKNVDTQVVEDYINRLILKINNK